MSMEEALAKNLGVEKVTACGGETGGCISKGSAFLVNNEKFFVKNNGKSGAR